MNAGLVWTLLCLASLYPIIWSLAGPAPQSERQSDLKWNFCFVTFMMVFFLSCFGIAIIGWGETIFYWLYALALTMAYYKRQKDAADFLVLEQTISL